MVKLEGKMKIFGLVTGALVTILGLSIMLTPLRMYFLIGWVIGIVLTCNGLSLLLSGIKKEKKNKGLTFIGIVTTLVGIILLVTDLQQLLTEIIIVYLITGGIMFSGLVECIIGFNLKKRGKNPVPALLIGGISLAVGLAGIIFHDATVKVIGLVVGYHIVRIGITIFMATYNGGKVVNAVKDLDSVEIIDIQ